MNMGMLRSRTNREGLTVRGIRLGNSPIAARDGAPLSPGDTISEAWFVWSHPTFPDGVVNADGSITEDEVI